MWNVFEKPTSRTRVVQMEASAEGCACGKEKDRMSGEKTLMIMFIWKVWECLPFDFFYGLVRWKCHIEYGLPCFCSFSAWVVTESCLKQKHWSSTFFLNSEAQNLNITLKWASLKSIFSSCFCSNWNVFFVTQLQTLPQTQKNQLTSRDTKTLFWILRIFFESPKSFSKVAYIFFKNET